MWIRRKDGSILPQLLSITRICEAEAGCCRYVGFYSDITNLKADQARLEKLAHFDPLTGLANRMLCHDRLRAAIARAHRADHHVATLFIDLDGFKQVNDRLGHQTGDMLLVEVAERMRACVREDDTVARLGGDEFVVILNEVGDRASIRELAERVLQATRVTLGAGAAELSVSGSIGIACYPQDGEAEELLLERADQAMYQAKQAGKGQLAFYRAD
jgi:diguanylate cyclase (GGDEF)-like protein